MTKFSVGFGLASVLSLVLASSFGYLTTQRAHAASPNVTSADATPPVYRPVTSDLMNAIIQPRHIKLWLAGQAQNWVLADYERHNLQGAFRRLATAIPDYKGSKMTDLIDTFTSQSFADLDAAIKAKDEAGFVKAYGALTDGCNACHQSTDHAMAQIKVPDRDVFPDQEFAVPHS